MTTRQKIDHRSDDLKHRGYDYHGKILKNTLSQSLYLEKTREDILNAMESVITDLVDNTKNIKKFFNWVHPKYFTNFN